MDCFGNSELELVLPIWSLKLETKTTRFVQTGSQASSQIRSQKLAIVLESTESSEFIVNELIWESENSEHTLQTEKSEKIRGRFK